MTPSPPRRLPVLIDTDPGVDDALALVYALRSGRFDVKALTVVAGNCGVDQGVENAFRILEVLARFFEGRGEPWDPPPVYRGAERPVGIEHEDALDVHGSDGLGGICRLSVEGRPRYPCPAVDPAPGNAVDAILQVVSDHPGEITLITLGPLTNVALAIRQDARTMAKVRQVVCMAGAFREPGNVTPSAEYNVWADPEACAETLHFYAGEEISPAEGDSRIRFIGLDVTHSIVLTREMLEHRAGEGPLSRFLLDCTAATMEFHLEAHGFEGLHLHDPVAVLAAERPDLFTFERLPVQVECRGEYTRGMTLADTRDIRLPKFGLPVEVGKSAKVDETLNIFMEGVFGGTNIRPHDTERSL
ncbi:MAG: nucleoside hydrolase [Armatimonadetes bacterium]|nr:nucleoside hydrolase [Armatimonadota bacterium]